MKRHNIFTALVVAIMTIGSITLVSCDKDNSLSTHESVVTPKSDVSNDAFVHEFDIAGMEHYCNGVHNGDIESLNNDSIIGVVYGGSIYYFDNDSQFYAFCTQNGLNGLYTSNKNLDLIYAKAVELGIQDNDYEDLDDVPSAMKEYWYSIFGTEFGTIPGGNSNANARLTWALTAYDGMSYSGSSKTCFGFTYPTLGKFNNKTTSFKVYNSGIGGIWWCHKKWYKKPRKAYWLVGLPIGMVGVPYVGDYHNNKFCSYFTVL